MRAFTSGASVSAPRTVVITRPAAQAEGLAAPYFSAGNSALQSGLGTVSSGLNYLPGAASTIGAIRYQGKSQGTTSRTKVSTRPDETATSRAR